MTNSNLIKENSKEHLRILVIAPSKLLAELFTEYGNRLFNTLKFP